MDQGKIVEDNLKNLKRNSLLRQTIALQFFKGCLPQILLGPFLNTLSQMCLTNMTWYSQRFTWNFAMFYEIIISLFTLPGKLLIKKQTLKSKVIREEDVKGFDLVIWKISSSILHLLKLLDRCLCRYAVGKYLFKVSIKDIGITSMYIPQD